MRKKIRSALISVYYKDKLERLLELLKKHEVCIYSTGGTKKFIEEKHIPVIDVAQMTGFPEILGGRVKTLHPKVFGGILARRDEAGDMAQLAEHGIQEIDLVVVDLYPFEETLNSDATEQELIEKIDIGGISLIRAAAKNFKDTLILSSKDQYETLADILEEKAGATDLQDRRLFAAQAFEASSHYDTAIFNWFNRDYDLPVFKQSIRKAQSLRYGENPHQKALFFGSLDELFHKHSGKELSYNNLVDIDAALNLIAEFSPAPKDESAPIAESDVSFVIIKHTNACGLASRATAAEAYEAAFACDTSSAFGGILCTNARIDLSCAEKMQDLFFEVLIAPAFDADALALLTKKPNRILLSQKKQLHNRLQFKNSLNGALLQETDSRTESRQEMKQVTVLAPEAHHWSDLEFAVKAVKHLKSNTIVLVKNKQLVGMGCGQTSRIDALRDAIEKAATFGLDLTDAVMASDAFFPFPDCVEIASKAGIRCVVQPGGSVKDQLSIDYCNAQGIAMVMTGIRHFKH